MRSKRRKAIQWAVALGMSLSAFMGGGVEAFPEEGKVRSGAASISKEGNTLLIDQHTRRVALDWTSFNIAKGETVKFNQQKNDIAVNRILSNSASAIYGSLQADGTVFLINPHGILFGQGAQIDVGSLVASTAQVSDSFMTGFGDSVEAVSLELGEASVGKVVNAGEIKAQGGLVALHATAVENTGNIVNHEGQVALAAVKNLNIAIDTAGKLNFTASGERANAHTLNTGHIAADGGYVVMTAKSAGDMLSEVVNNEGIIEARSINVNEQGEILLDGGAHGTVNVSGTLDASGSEAGTDGGTLRVAGEQINIREGADFTASGQKLVMQAQRNISVNAPITVGEGQLNIELHADADGDAKGLVEINADIDTRGGDFTAGTGQRISDGTVGTYFGHGKGEGDDVSRQLKTNGGAVNLYGDVAAGVKEGSLVIDTTKADGTGGDINITGNLDSAHEYKAFVNNGSGGADVKNDANMKRLAKTYYDTYLKNVVWKTFDQLTESEYQAIRDRCLNQYEGYNNRVKPEPNSAAERAAVKSYFETHVQLGVSAVPKEFEELTTQDKGSNYSEYTKLAKHILTNWAYNRTDNRESILNRWELAKEAAKEGTAGGSAVGDKYLATITTALEDWLVSSLVNSKDYELLLGGRTDDAARSVKAGREFRWLTGPEGEANNNTGTRFFTATGAGTGVTDADMYQGWSHDVTDAKNKFNEPNNDSVFGQSYVAVGRRVDTSWADVENQKNNVKGFIQEINTAPSSIELKSGSGNVSIGGNVGKSAVVKDLNIAADGSVNIGGGANAAAKSIYSGQVHTTGEVKLAGDAAVNYKVVYSNESLTIIENDTVLDLTGFGDEIASGGAADLIETSTVINEGILTDPFAEFGENPAVEPEVIPDAAQIAEAEVTASVVEIESNPVIEPEREDVPIAEPVVEPVIASADEPVAEPVVKPVSVSEQADSPLVETAAKTAEPKAVEIKVDRPQIAYIRSMPSRGAADYQSEKESKESSVEMVMGLTATKLPLVKMVNGTASSYGTYRFSVEPGRVSVDEVDGSVPQQQNVRLSDYREYTRKLITERGEAEFRLVYDGSVLAIHPVGPEAKRLLVEGDAAHNVDITSQAMQVAFTEMGLELEDVDAVYVCFE